MYSNELISPVLHSGPILLEILLDRKDGLPASSTIAVFRLFSTIPFLIGGLPIFSVPLLSPTRYVAGGDGFRHAAAALFGEGVSGLDRGVWFREGPDICSQRG